MSEERPARKTGTKPSPLPSSRSKTSSPARAAPQPSAKKKVKPAVTLTPEARRALDDNADGKSSCAFDVGVRPCSTSLRASCASLTACACCLAAAVAEQAEQLKQIKLKAQQQADAAAQVNKQQEELKLDQLKQEQVGIQHCSS